MLSLVTWVTNCKAPRIDKNSKYAYDQKNVTRSQTNM